MIIWADLLTLAETMTLSGLSLFLFNPVELAHVPDPVILHHVTVPAEEVGSPLKLEHLFGSYLPTGQTGVAGVEAPDAPGVLTVRLEGPIQVFVGVQVEGQVSHIYE